MAKMTVIMSVKNSDLKIPFLRKLLDEILDRFRHIRFVRRNLFV